MRRIKTILFFVLAIQVCSSAQSLHTAVPYHSTPAPFGYYEYLPDGYFASVSYFPLVIYLHGTDERGNGTTDLSKILIHGPSKLISNGKDFPFIVLSPQSLGGFFNPETLREFISYASITYKVDKSRIYLTGISSGAISIWNYLSLYQDQVAAVVPIAGNGYNALSKACKMSNIPVWAFHGDQDKQVKPGGSIGIINAINKCKPAPKVPAKLTLYPKVGHDSWTRTYDLSGGYDIYDWMLKQSRTSGKSTPIKNGPATGTAFKELSTVVKLPVPLKRSSGIVVANPNRIWCINNGNNDQFIYLIDTLGKVIEVKKVTNSTNLAWSDITKDEKGNLYVADIGNPNNSRRALQIYKIKEPSGAQDERISSEKIEFTLPDQKSFPPDASNFNFDFESIVHFNDSLFIFSRNRSDPFSGIVKMYRLPDKPGNYVAELRDSLFIGNDHPPQFQITSASISPNQKNLILLTRNKIWVFKNFTKSNFLKGQAYEVNLPLFSEKLAVDFVGASEVYITDLSFRDMQGGKLYRINLKEWLAQ